MDHMPTFHVILLGCTIGSRLILNDAEATTLCPREPPGTNSERNPGDGGFRITVDDDSHLQHYVPERVYRISIAGTSLKHTFTGAYLVAVAYNSSDNDVTVGKFHLVDGGRLAFHVECSDVVTTVDSLPKAEVYVMWTSSVLRTGCVQFRATVMQTLVWYKDDGALMKVLCPEEADDSNTGNIDDTDSSSKVDCCACGTAKYQLTFHGLWSQGVHQNDVVNMSQFHWSPLVGSSHSKHYVMWHFNTLASQGVKDICHHGDTRALEDEIRHQSSNVRTVIRTPGMPWTRGYGLRQQRWAHFSVDSKHHLLSVLSRLNPSPDWCVGVSALDLCLENCTWLADISVRLFAWDAGVSNSAADSSEIQRNYPARPIHRLPAAGADSTPRLPFRRDRQAEPVAVLRLRRFDPYPEDDVDDAACSGAVAKDQGTTKLDESVADISHGRRRKNPCVMGSWSQWSGCSASCGAAGTRSRSRTAVVATESCADLLETASEPCETGDCETQCEMHGWSEWSACSDGLVLCSADDRAHVRSCSRHRSRSFRHPGAEAFCTQSVEDEESCKPPSDAGVFTTFNTDVMSKCFSAADSGPCARNLRRWYYDASRSGCRTFLYGGCRGNANRYVTEEDCMQSCGQYEGNVMKANTDDGRVKTDTAGMTSSRISLVGGTVVATKSEHGTVKPDENVGASVSGAADCVMSSWSAWSECSVTCGRNGVRSRRRTVRRRPSGGGRRCPRRTLRRRRCSMPACESDCQYAEWSPWSPCARSCGLDTVQERIRRRLRGSLSRTSLQCPVKLQRRLCSLPQCFVN